MPAYLCDLGGATTVSNVWGENGVREKYWCHLFNLPDTKGRLSIKQDSALTNSKNDWSSFDTQLRNFEENVCHQWLRLAGWGFYKVASTGKTDRYEESLRHSRSIRVFLSTMVMTFLSSILMFYFIAKFT